MTDKPSRQDSVTIERTFDAPVELVWQLWTDPKQFASWYGPAGATIPVATMQVWVGGIRLVCMEMMTPAGPRRMWFTGEYREVIDHKRVVYTESMSNEDGEVLAPEDLGLPAGHSTTTEIRVDLEDVDGLTRMIMTHVGVPAGSPGAAGWIMSFDKLTAYLDSRH